MNVGDLLGSCFFFASDSWEGFVVVEIARGSDISFNCILWGVVELYGCRVGLFLESYSVRYKNGINIVVVRSTRLVDLGVEEIVLFMILSMSVLA